MSPAATSVVRALATSSVSSATRLVSGSSKWYVHGVDIMRKQCLLHVSNTHRVGICNHMYLCAT